MCLLRVPAFALSVPLACSVRFGLYHLSFNECMFSLLSWQFSASAFPGELAPAILATLLIGGKHVDVLVVHMGVDT